MSEAIFSSGYEACRFAYAFNGQQYPMSVMAKIMQCVGIGSGRGLSGLDGAAIAGTVKRHVEAMPMPNPLIITCRHELDEKMAVEYAMLLVEFVMPAMGTGGHNRRMVRDLICRYFRIKVNGADVQLNSLCHKYGLNMSEATMTRRWQSVYRKLREMESGAQGRIDDDLKDAGVT